MRGIAQYDAEGAAIVQKLRTGELKRPQAFEMLQARVNPLSGMTDQNAGKDGWQDMGNGIKIRKKQ
jgi:hypothetical protein